MFDNSYGAILSKFGSRFRWSYRPQKKQLQHLPLGEFHWFDNQCAPEDAPSMSVADQMLWAARLAPARPAKSLTRPEMDELHKVLRKTIRDAIKGGGVHTLSVVPFRKAEAHCPRDGAPMRKSTVGGRTTWFCSKEQH